MLAALKQGDIKTANQLELTYLRNVHHLAKLLGRIVNRSQVQSVNITYQRDYVELRQVIINALAEHPDARMAMVQALDQFEASRLPEAEREEKFLTLPPGGQRD
jgi:hypothetical protein